MSNQPETQHTTYPQMPSQAPKPPKASKLKRFGLPTGLLLLGLIIGGASGASAVPEPVEVVKEVPGPERVVEKKVNVPVTPQTCRDAITHGEAVIQSSSRVAGIFSEIIDAVRAMDSAAIIALNPKIDTETAILNEIRPKYQAARDACRAG